MSFGCSLHPSSSVLPSGCIACRRCMQQLHGVRHTLRSVAHDMLVTSRPAWLPGTCTQLTHTNHMIDTLSYTSLLMCVHVSWSYSRESIYLDRAVCASLALSRFNDLVEVRRASLALSLKNLVQVESMTSDIVGRRTDAIGIQFLNPISAMHPKANVRM